MEAVEVEIKGAAIEIRGRLLCTCTRCGHMWLTRKKKKPRVCPACKSAFWDTERVRHVKKKARQRD